MGRRAWVAIQSTLLLLGSLLVALLLCEGMARLYSHLAHDETNEVVATSPADVVLLKKYFNVSIASLPAARILEQPLADRYVPNIAVAKGIDRTWFHELPAGPDRDPKDVGPQDAALQAEYIRRGLYGPQSFYIWNEQFARAQTCDGQDELFKNPPKPVKVFRSLDGRPDPIYRFPASRTLPSGLKTNRYGFRGPDFPQARSPNAIRIAFVGSSETVADHKFPFSYPEYFGIWLNRWLAANGNGLKAEIINAGREGIGTTDVAAILEQEVLPLAPDYVIFYDGANQLANAQSLVEAAADVQNFTLKEALRGPTLLPESWTIHSRLAKIANDTNRLYLAPVLDEWRRPNYVFSFPAKVNEANPDIDDPNLPLGLPGFLGDLRTMTNATRAAGVPFMISTLVWLDGSELTPGNPDQATIRALLKSMFWPLKPGEIRRLIDFSNRTLRKFAQINDVGLLEIADEFPRDADLFSDAYHMRPEGLKLLAWIGLQHFLPRLMRDLGNGKLGKTPEVSLRLPLPVGDDFLFDCRPTPKAMAAARVVPLPALKRGSEGVFLRHGPSGLSFRSTPEPSSDIAQTPLLVGCVKGGGWVAADIHVIHGTVGVRVLNRKGDDVVVQRSAAIGDAVQTIFLRLYSFADAGDFILENWDQSSASDGILQAVRIAAEDGATPAECDPDPAATKALGQARSVSLGAMALGAEGASLQSSASGIAFRSLPDPWAYIGRMPLTAGCLEGGGWVAADIRVTRGIVGIGALNRSGDEFLVQRSAEAGDAVQTVVLPLDSFAAAGDLVLLNWNERSISEGILQRVRIASESGTTPAGCEPNRAAAENAAQARSHPAADLSEPATNLPLDSLRPQHGGDLSADDGSVVLTTSPQQWAYAASAPIALPPETVGSGVVRLRLQVEKGKLGVGVFARDHSSDMLTEQAVDPSDAPTDVDINIADLANAGSIVFRSWSPNGVSVRARILAISILQQQMPHRAEFRP